MNSEARQLSDVLHSTGQCHTLRCALLVSPMFELPTLDSFGRSSEPRESSSRLAGFMGHGDAASRCLAPGCMPRTDVMRTVLKQSEGVDNELVAEGQERPVHLRSARAVDLRFKLAIKRRPSAGRRCGVPWDAIASDVDGWARSDC
jgi:hypothetical protein